MSKTKENMFSQIFFLLVLCQRLKVFNVHSWKKRLILLKDRDENISKIYYDTTLSTI